MKKIVRIVLLLVFVFFVFLFLVALTASAADVPGGVVFVENGQIVYHDFKIGDKINLTAGLNKQFSPNTEFTVSGDGTTLFWTDETGRIWMRPSLAAEPSPIKVLLSGSSGRNAIWPDLAVAGAKNPVVSFTGQKLAFEYPKRSRVSQDFCNAIVYMEVDKTGIEGIDRIPGKTCDVILSKIHHDAPMSVANMQWSCNSCGNTAGSFGEAADLTRTALRYTPEQAFPRFSIQRDAYFGCWSKEVKADKQMLAIIYKTPFGWGPIELRTECGYGLLLRQNSSGKNFRSLNENQRNMKPGLYEIPARLRVCYGMAFKPNNGDLVVFGLAFEPDSSPSAYILKKQDIYRGIEASGIAKYNGGKGLDLVPRNNVFQVKPEVISVGQGSGYCWPSDNQLVFRSGGKLQLWENGNSTVIMDSIPVNFHCCERPPQAGVQHIARAGRGG